jgi:hypothetical protein
MQPANPVICRAAGVQRAHDPPVGRSKMRTGKDFGEGSG